MLPRRVNSASGHDWGSRTWPEELVHAGNVSYKHLVPQKLKAKGQPASPADIKGQAASSPGSIIGNRNDEVDTGSRLAIHSAFVDGAGVARGEGSRQDIRNCSQAGDADGQDFLQATPLGAY